MNKHLELVPLVLGRLELQLTVAPTLVAIVEPRLAEMVVDKKLGF